MTFTFLTRIDGTVSEYVVRVEFENGTKVEDRSDLYNTAFLQALLLRPSCSKCVFANLDRVGDITIGDFKNRYEVLPEAKGLENLSTIIINTEKGKEVFKALGNYMEIYPIKLCDVVRTNNTLRQPSMTSERRDGFFCDLAMGVPIEIALATHVTVPGLMRRTWMLIPDRMRAGVKRGIPWIRK